MTGQDRGGWASLLCDDPPIVATWSIPDFPLGAMSVPGALAGRQAHAIVLPAWSLELPHMSAQLAEAAHAHLRSNPRHGITIAGSNDAEVGIMRSLGCTAVLVNLNCLIDETIFRPLPQIEPQFDAVYNGRLSSDKRHELAVDVNSLALVFFVNLLEHDAASFHASYARHRLLLPNATFVNPLTPDGCRRLEREEVNEVYARSRVGLCLSAIEGSMRVSMEYMLAGLPLVSTRSLGGREHFFDPDYCIVVDDDPRAVREATDALVCRAIPRSYIREKTLVRLRRARVDFATIVDELIVAGGGTAGFSGRMDAMLRAGAIMHWKPLEPFIRSVERMLSCRNGPQ